MSTTPVLSEAARQQIQALAIEGAQHRHIASIIADESPFPRHGHRLAFADCDHPDCKFVRDLDRVLAALACEGEGAQDDVALIKQIVIGWDSGDFTQWHDALRAARKRVGFILNAESAGFEQRTYEAGQQLDSAARAVRGEAQPQGDSQPKVQSLSHIAAVITRLMRFVGHDPEACIGEGSGACECGAEQMLTDAKNIVEGLLATESKAEARAPEPPKEPR